MQQYQAHVQALLVEAEADLRRRLRTVGDLDGIEAAARGMADQLARRLVEELLSGADHALQQIIPSRWRLVGNRERTLMSTVGPLRLRRRLYRDPKGHARLPLDEELGLAPRARVTPHFQEVAVELCSRVPFGAASHLLRKILPATPSRVTLHRLLGQVGQQRQAQGERLRRRVFDEGDPGAGERRVTRLFIEADGKWIHLQRTPAHRDRELYLGLAHEGWEAEGKQRWRLQAKQVHMEVRGGPQFWETFSAYLGARYDLRQTRVVIGGDGADWVRQGTRYFHRAEGQLDRFHLAQALRRVLVGGAWRGAYRAACRGELLVAIRALQQSGHPDALDVIRYLRANRSGLPDYRLREGFRDPSLRGLGAAEGNVDKLVANRFCKRGMAWTIEGAQRMAKVLEASHNGALHESVPRRPLPERRHAPLKKFLRTHVANAAVGVDVGTTWRAPFVNHSTRDYGSVLRRIGRGGTVWWNN